MGKSKKAKCNSPAYRFNEGPRKHRCTSHCHCDGARTCSRWKWCQGRSRSTKKSKKTRKPKKKSKKGKKTKRRGKKAKKSKKSRRKPKKGKKKGRKPKKGKKKGRK